MYPHVPRETTGPLSQPYHPIAAPQGSTLPSMAPTGNERVDTSHRADGWVAVWTSHLTLARTSFIGQFGQPFCTAACGWYHRLKSRAVAAARQAQHGDLEAAKRAIDGMEAIRHGHRRLLQEAARHSAGPTQFLERRNALQLRQDSGEFAAFARRPGAQPFNELMAQLDLCGDSQEGAHLLRQLDGLIHREMQAASSPKRSAMSKSVTFAPGARAGEEATSDSPPRSGSRQISQV